jgi:hypothetical protein
MGRLAGKKELAFAKKRESRVNIYLLVALVVLRRRIPEVHHSRRLSSLLLCLISEPPLCNIAEVTGCREATMGSGRIFVVLCLKITSNGPTLTSR